MMDLFGVKGIFPIDTYNHLMEYRDSGHPHPKRHERLGARAKNASINTECATLTLWLLPPPLPLDTLMA